MSLRRFVCPMSGCSFSTNKKYKYEEHLRVHTGERPFACQACGMTFRRVDHLKRHEESHDSSRERRFKCPWEGCTASFVLRHHLNRHIELHQDPKPHKCPVEGCLEAFSKKSQLSSHLSRAHGISSSHHICPEKECKGRKFATARQLQRHLIRFHPKLLDHPPPGVVSMDDMLEGCGVVDAKGLEEGGKTIKMYACPVKGCPRRYARKSSLGQHMKVKHPEEGSGKKFVCELCQKEFSYSHVLERHRKNVHGDAAQSTSAKEDDRTSDEWKDQIQPHSKRAKEC
eukprot:TRINITY_DN28989_c0_g1_i1.p1 TRINITY_DN28989_c0_g1~~TRINITY_DN28989_c0_g1_i1.p1  ORF type:complete len:284 (-),score=51.81 TRINITY_DN28989_c0_g1_i1:53-904(-)